MVPTLARDAPLRPVRRVRLPGLALAAACLAAASGARVAPQGHYAAPDGLPTAAGTAQDPWDLATALAGGRGRVTPGDTVWLRGCIYRGAFVSTLAGRPGAPVVVRQYPGERAMVDAAGAPGDQFVVRGEWSVFWGFELTNSEPTRVTTSRAHNARPNLLINNASHTKYINLVVRDGGVAFYTFPDRQDVEVYGSVFYNNGWQQPRRGAGHGLYVKSDVGPVVLEDNILFNQFGYGVHAYSDAGSGRLANIRVSGNVAFNNGTVASTPEVSANILVGGGDVASGAVVRDNLTYFSPGIGGANVVLGWGERRNRDVVVERNRLVGGSPVLELGFWAGAQVEGNTLTGAGVILRQRGPATADYRWDHNVHGSDARASAWWYRGARRTFDEWRRTSGLGRTDTARLAQRAAPEVFVRPNRYESGRATIVVYNWPRQPTVEVDLAAVLPVGTEYVVHNVQNLAGAPVVRGTYKGGAIALPLGGVPPPVPVGMRASPAPRTGPEFDVFVLTSVRAR